MWENEVYLFENLLQDYHQCNDRNTSLSEVMGGMTCPAKCLVNCEEDRFSVELSSR